MQYNLLKLRKPFFEIFLLVLISAANVENF